MWKTGARSLGLHLKLLPGCVLVQVGHGDCPTDPAKASQPAGGEKGMGTFLVVECSKVGTSSADVRYSHSEMCMSQHNE